MIVSCGVQGLFAFNFKNIDCNSLKQSLAPISFLKMESVGQNQIFHEVYL